MLKKIVSLILSVVLAVSGCWGLVSCSNNSTSNNSEITQQEYIDEIVSYALDEADYRIEDYIDVAPFVNLGLSESTKTNSVYKNQASVFINENDRINLEIEQYDALTSSISGIFSELTDEQYEVVETLAEEDSDIAELLQMVETDFESYGIETDSKITVGIKV